MKTNISLRIIEFIVFGISLILLATLLGAGQADASPCNQFEGRRLAKCKRKMMAKRDRRKNRRQRNRRPQVEKEQEAAAATGETMHAEQEGTDEPYFLDISLLSDLSVNKQKTGEASTGTADYNLGLRALYIIGGSFEVGPEITYFESSYKTEDETNTSDEYTLGLLAKYNFGELDKDIWVPFVGVGFGIGAGKSKVGEEETKSSSTRFGLDLGTHYFVDSNVALTGEVGYDTGSRKVDGQDEKSDFTELQILKLGFSLFL